MIEVEENSHDFGNENSSFEHGGNFVNFSKKNTNFVKILLSCQIPFSLIPQFIFLKIFILVL